MRFGYHSHCGCCGQPNDETREWCDRCEEHVTTDGPPWRRTYYAQHGVPCPNENVDALCFFCRQRAEARTLRQAIEWIKHIQSCYLAELKRFLYDAERLLVAHDKARVNPSGGFTQTDREGR